jgi:glycosyltransferase involved in cell wall biosynthesis
MKVLHISGAMSWRGGEQQLVNLYHALTKSGIEQTVFCPKNSALVNYCVSENISHYTYTKTGGFNLPAAFQLKKMGRLNKNFDLLHLHDSDAHTIGYLAYLLGVTTPMVLSRKVVFKIKSSLFTIKKYNAACIKKIICVSEAVKNVVATRVVDKSKLTVIHEGIEPIDAASIIPFSLPAEITGKNFDFIAGYIAALTAEKDHETFLQVAQLLIKKGMNIGFVLAGDGKVRQKIELRIKELGLSQYVFLIGFCKEIPSLLKRLDVLLFTSTQEGFPITILEAFFMHLPVVTTNAGGIAEMVENGKTGFSAPVGDTEQLAAKVEMVLQNPQLAKELADNARQFVQQFTYIRMAQQVLDLYKQVIKE